MQPTAVLFPDAELWCVDYLQSVLTERDEDYTFDVYVGIKIPKSRPERMVIIRRDGGSSDGLFDRPRLSVRTWMPTDQQSTDLARLVAALLWAAPGDGVCVRTEQLSGPSSIADESKQALRYQLFEATLRGELLS